MAYFEKSLQAVATLDSVLTTANETFRTEQKKLLATLKDPTKQIGEMRKAQTETEAEQKRIFRETVQAEFAAVRATVNTVVTTAPPADFLATLEAIKANGKNITDYEAAAFMEKYKGNYFAFRTLHPPYLLTKGLPWCALGIKIGHLFQKKPSAKALGFFN